MQMVRKILCCQINYFEEWTRGELTASPKLAVSHGRKTKMQHRILLGQVGSPSESGQISFFRKQLLIVYWKFTTADLRNNSKRALEKLWIKPWWRNHAIQLDRRIRYLSFTWRWNSELLVTVSIMPFSEGRALGKYTSTSFPASLGIPSQSCNSRLLGNCSQYLSPLRRFPNPIPWWQIR